MTEDRAVLQRLRTVMARELDTVNQYEAFADATDDPEAKLLFQHLADEEKEHVQEVFEILLRRDPAQAAWAHGAHVEAIRSGRLNEALAAGTPARGSVQPAVGSVPSPVRPLPLKTVGSLLGQPQI